MMFDQNQHKKLFVIGEHFAIFKREVDFGENRVRLFRVEFEV